MSLLLRSDTFVEAHEHYQKQTYRNRCAIVGAQGIMTLSIPVEGGANDHCPIRDVYIAEHDNWRHKHWQTIASCYGTSPYFEYYAPDIEPLYRSSPEGHVSLYDFDRQLIETLARLLHLPQYSWRETTEYGISLEQKNLTRLLQPDQVCDSIDLPSYYQIFREKLGFKANLSIYDLLFNMGPEALLVLRSISPFLD